MLSYQSNGARNDGGAGNGPLEVFRSFWNERTLLRRLVKREVEARYRGSLFGLAWTFVTPVVLVAVYTFVFSVIFGMRWKGIDGAAVGDNVSFGIVLFTGLVLFQFFSDSLNRAPGLMLENPTYIKKIVFPLDLMAWVSLGVGLVNLAAGVLVLVLAHLVLIGLPPPTALLFPILLLPLGLLTVGLVWIVSAVGVYLRDLRQIVGLVTTIMMFLSPIFYPLSMVPEAYRSLLHLNPLTWPITAARQLLLEGTVPPVAEFGIYTAVAFLTAWVGLVFFRKVKRGFIDVL